MYMFIVLYIHYHMITLETRDAQNITNELKILIMCYSAQLIQVDYKETHKTVYGQRYLIKNTTILSVS